MLSFAQAQTHFSYDATTGQLFWKVVPSNVIKIGQQAGALNSDGYRQIKFMGQVYQAHYVVWLLNTGQWPNDEIDHEDGNRDNNRFANLRDATRRENSQYRTKRSDNLSGYKGVNAKPNGKFRARIFVKGRNVNLGTYSTAQKAAQVYDEAALKAFGQFALTNKGLGLL